MNKNPLTPAAAQNLLSEAGRLGAASRSGASWPQITMLLGLGAISSISLLAFWLVAQVDESLIWIPMTALLVWLGIFMATMFHFGKSTKAGFTRRWLLYIAVWAVLWAVGCFIGLFFFKDDLWFFAATAVAITIATVWGAWTEASK